MVESDAQLLNAINIRNFLLDSDNCDGDMPRDRKGEYDPWYDIIEQYTRQSLSVQSDIFPALQGISKRFQRHRGSKFLAGLWESSMIKSLLWRSSLVDGQGTTRPQQWRAPSWSWASVIGPVEWPTRGHFFLELATYLRGDTALESSELYGEITSGMITLVGRCMLAEMGESSFHLIQAISPQQRPYAEQSIDFIAYGDRYWTVSYYIRQFVPDYNFTELSPSRPHSTVLATGTEVKILLMAESRPSRPQGIRTHFLVLRTVQEEERLYERIGHIVLRETDMFTVDNLPLDVEAEILNIV
ncbi:hypothetical protein NX059_009581 [Plenodomus lindquistii]|nr:hypothetical protein NX059_009581 [Plenodomus lindquistii]